jgi:ABC-type sugar transport system substrate-binding protein
MLAIVSAARLSRPLLLLLLLALAGGLILAATLGLWMYYGTAVFFEVVRAGWAACF